MGVDIIGLAVVVLVAVCLAVGTWRGWHVRSSWIRWPFVILGGLLTVLAAAVLVSAGVGFARLNQHYNNAAPDVRVAGTADQIARGQHLAYVCASCHSLPGGLPLAGADFIAKFGFPSVGTFYAPNLTPAGEIADWTDGEVIRAIREGIHQNGRSLLVMPAENLRHLSDEDVQSLVAYLRAQPATGEATPGNRFSVFGALFVTLADLRSAQPPAGTVSRPVAGTPEYGRYMVDVIGCRSCHGDQLQGKAPGGPPGPPPGPNLTQSGHGWTEAQFMMFFNAGQRPDGTTVPTERLANGQETPRMPWPEVRAVATDDELRAMYAYLHALPPRDSPY
jgi:mono/diheme cytochrome c family protein